MLPHIFYRSVPDAVEWLTRVLGFQENYRYGDSKTGGAQMFLGGAFVMLASCGHRSCPAESGYGTQSLTIFVPDVDAHFAGARAQGANIVEDLNETIYGERQYGVEDLDGHQWLFSQHARDVAPEEWGAVVARRGLRP